ncbi:hypothetical protein B0H14DRAFT_2874612 [Mycena olivaceomarginata]|nr:hypothetical protein B0H14DRAFT_2874612 [Mycena olivaceomarginata]
MLAILQLFAVAALLVESVSSQATTLPQCAVGCARTYAIKAGCASDLTDTPCLCQTSFAANVIQCTRTTSCSKAEQAQVSAILSAMCAGVSSGSESVGASVTGSSTSVASLPPSARSSAGGA